MDYLLGIIVALVGAVFYFKKQSDKNKADAIIGETKGQDKVLKENQDKAQRTVDEANSSIKEITQEREKQRKEYEAKTRSERADDWNKKND